MKNLWWIALILAYGTWTVLSIIDIVKSIKQWIEDNTKIIEVKKEGNDDIVPETIKKKVWTGRRDFSDIFEYLMEGYSTAWLWTTLIIIFCVSLVMWIVSMTKN